LPSQCVISAIPPAGVPVAAAAVTLLGLVFPHLAGLRADRIGCGPGGLEISARAVAAGAACRACGAWSSRVHSGYARQVEDSPVAGRPVVIRLAVRRFFCGNPDCPRLTFAEQVEGLTARYRRRSVPLLGSLARIGLALAGRAGTRLAAVLGIAVHRTTLLRLVMAMPDPEVSAAPEVLGVDDFALRKGHVYGTVLVSIATGKTVDVLADREAGTLEEWLRAHPGAKVICRDRGGAYAEGARAGAPDAIQVADRWHLWHNLAGYAEKTVAAHRGCLTGTAPRTGDAAARPGPRPPRAEPPPDGLLDSRGRERRVVARTRERHAAVHELLAAGRTLGEARAATGMSRSGLRRYARAATADELLAGATGRETILDPYKPYLKQRWNEGITSTAVLHAELRARGYHGSAATLRGYLRPLRQLPPPAPAPAPAGPAPGTAPLPDLPKTRKITRWLLTRPATLDPAEQEQLDAILARCPHLNDLAGHIRAFAEMMTSRTGQDLPGWLEAAEASGQPQLRSFTAGIRRDLRAVTSGLTLPWSSGPVEGNVNRIKMIKRQMYGRASFALLRKRVLLAS